MYVYLCAQTVFMELSINCANELAHNNDNAHFK